jgi:hypothetical protein
MPSTLPARTLGERQKMLAPRPVRTVPRVPGVAETAIWQPWSPVVEALSRG